MLEKRINFFSHALGSVSSTQASDLVDPNFKTRLCHVNTVVVKFPFPTYFHSLPQYHECQIALVVNTESTRKLAEVRRRSAVVRASLVAYALCLEKLCLEQLRAAKSVLVGYRTGM